MNHNTAAKIKSRKEIADIIAKLHSTSKKTGYTSGVFDILHPGHIDYLQKAKAECDVLIVGVNSDSSVKQNKGENRPICEENDRALLVAALECVDYVFLFSEKNNNTNIEQLKPAVYIKAADYDKSKLSSAPLVEAYGGQVKLIPFLKGYSSSKIIAKIEGFRSSADTNPIAIEPYPKMPAVFLDRDGTINKHVEYLHEPQKFELLPGAMEGLAEFQRNGYRIIVVTNQAGIGMGYFAKEDLFRVHKEMLRLAHSAGVAIDRIYFCPHSQADNCSCRKPAPGMIERAVKELNIDLENSYVIGDMTSDIQLAKNAGCKSVLVKSGEAGKDGKYQVTPDMTAENLLDAAQKIIHNKS